MREVCLMVSAGLLSACSVGMAARTGGVKAEEVTQCQTRDCFISQDNVEILERKDSNGRFSETYKFQLKRGSAGRAAMHGLLDVATLGVWEVVGTPIEATKKKKYVVITAHYDDKGRLLTKSIGADMTPDALTDHASTSSTAMDVKPAYYNGEIIGAVMKDGTIRSFEGGQTLVAPKDIDIAQYIKPAIINGEYVGVMLSNGELYLFEKTASTVAEEAGT